MSKQTISRRSAAAGGVAMLVLAAAAAGQAKAEELDGDLLQLCRESRAQEDKLNQINDALEDVPWREREVHPLAATERAGVKRIHELRDLIADIPAQTPEGIMAKANIAYADLVPGKEWPSDNSTWIALSVLQDVLGRAST